MWDSVNSYWVFVTTVRARKFPILFLAKKLLFGTETMARRVSSRYIQYAYLNVELVPKLVLGEGINSLAEI